MEKTAVIFIGIQASGKSTFYKTRLGELVHINLDTLKTRHREKLLLEQCIADGASFCVDNTNPTREDRARYLAPAKEAGYRIVGYFFQSRVADCVERNRTRDASAQVPSMAIAATSNKLQMPSVTEGVDELYFVTQKNGDFSVEEWREM